MVLEERFDLRPGEHQDPQHALGHDIGDGRFAEEDRDIAEELALAEGRTLLPVDANFSLALEDHIEAAAGEALPEDALAGREPRFIEDVGDALELWRREIGEQRHSRERVDDLFLARHPSPLSPARPAPLPASSVAVASYRRRL